ncbi:YjbF family lipoprotein [Yoonia litorea]|uniref:Group 4 capsule polysaccharide lipoprotein gfcB, YjbF n=1 Tax=Yoonia litorea TaxID=1123755 RepID=A0A1I6LNZ6_9RHOB|nr:YjbF family lipoprotein [Yoonia litorea]SFS05185.1 Group 4 capsule polysaccharide lipoprotein gfcB, YjbF [Yoonia litorea]
MRLLALITLLVGISACGPLQQTTILSTSLDLATDLAGFDTDDTSPDPRSGLSREMIENAPQDLMLFAPVSEDDASLLARVTENNGYVTWAEDRGIAIITQNGLVAGTRGLGNDLMGADLSVVYNALVSGQGRYARVHDYIGGNDAIVRARFECQVQTIRDDVLEIYGQRRNVRLVGEGCAGRAGQFSNLYWIASSGQIWQSRQWISAPVGEIDIQMLR